MDLELIKTEHHFSRFLLMHPVVMSLLTTFLIRPLHYLSKLKLNGQYLVCSKGMYERNSNK